jgi:methionyl-tRNA formyltransferase
MKIVYLGSSKFGIPSLEAILGSGHNLEFLVTQSAHQAGRGRKPRPTPAASWAKENSVPFIEVEDVNEPSVIEKIASYRPDLIVVIAFGQKISQELINLPAKGMVNVHASLLPKYRGAAPVNWPVINGENKTGISIITVAEKMDAGSILAQEETEIGYDETAGQLYEKLAEIAGPLLVKTIGQIAAGTAVYTEQDHSKATRARKLKKSDGFIDFAESAESLRRKILGLWPWPGACVVYADQKGSKCIRVVIAMAEVVKSSNPQGLAAGTLDENLDVICGQGALRIVRIKPAGGKLMDFKDFVNGRGCRCGDMFIKVDD